jgi:multiple sugar transport system substrate-binding protein
LMTSPETVDAMKKFSNLILVDKVAPPPAYYGDPNQIDKLFYSGKVGMIVAGTWYIANIAAEKPNIEYDFAPLPYMSKPSTVIHGIGHVVNTKSKNKDAAIKFALYTGLQKNQESMQKDLGWMSFYEGLPQKFASQDPNHHNDVFVDALDIGTPYPATPNMSVWEAELTKQMQLVLLGKSTVEDAMKKTADKMQEAFSK